MCPSSIGFQHLNRSYRSICYLSREVSIIRSKDFDDFGCAKPQPFVDSCGVEISRKLEVLGQVAFVTEYLRVATTSKLQS